MDYTSSKYDFALMDIRKNRQLKNYLNKQFTAFNSMDFIEDDPISIPHSYDLKEDIEIAGFWTAMLAWGQRKTIIKKTTELFDLMDNAPHEFILNHHESDRKRFMHFKHRTFNFTDTLYFLDRLQRYYSDGGSLEDAFLDSEGRCISIKESLVQFHNQFFDVPYAPERTRKHIATPERNSACKRLNMFLRWMVRKDEIGVDFGIWERINASQLMMPLDVHVARVARDLKLLNRKQNDWKAVEELTSNMRLFDSVDPVKYDFALFGSGINGSFQFFKKAGFSVF